MPLFIADILQKLQPFFPPLEPLQSLNLRAALFRCLDQAKKVGVLGRDTVLRKTMLDECKGERLEEVLAVFSNAVLKKVLQQAEETFDPAIAQQLAFENFSYSGERLSLSTLILAHKVSLRKHLQEKEDAKARYKDFADLLNLNERRITRRHEQLKQTIEERGSENKITEAEVRNLQDQVRKNWSGNDQWLETILYGDSRVNKEGLLATEFEKVWKHVEDGSIGDIEGKRDVGLLEQLNARVKDQESRLARWQAFGKTLAKAPVSPSKKKAQAEGRKIDLGFNLHQCLHIGRSPAEKVEPTHGASWEEYTRLIENMKAELADVGKPQAQAKPTRRSVLPDELSSSITASPALEKDESPVPEEEWSSASEVEDPIPELKSYAIRSTKALSTVVSEENEDVSPKVMTTHKRHDSLSRSPLSPKKAEFIKPAPPKEKRWPSPTKRSPPPQDPSPPAPQETQRPTTPPKPISIPPHPSEADQILTTISESSPSPKKARHTLSLAERTRLSMSRATHSKYSDLHDELDLPINKPENKPAAPKRVEDEDKHADLIERTRKSMAGFEAAQKKAQVERRKSVKEQKRRQRESSYFPRENRLREEDEGEPITPVQELVEMGEGEEADYESVFKSRPKVKTSPMGSPERSWIGGLEETGADSDRE
jgi:hypothetical protein